MDREQVIGVLVLLAFLLCCILLINGAGLIWLMVAGIGSSLLAVYAVYALILILREEASAQETPDTGEFLIQDCATYTRALEEINRGVMELVRLANGPYSTEFVRLMRSSPTDYAESANGISIVDKLLLGSVPPGTHWQNKPKALNGGTFLDTNRLLMLFVRLEKEDGNLVVHFILREASSHLKSPCLVYGTFLERGTEALQSLGWTPIPAECLCQGCGWSPIPAGSICSKCRWFPVF